MRSDALFSVLAALAGVTRFSSYKLCHRENVLEHSGAVTLVCLLLGRQARAAGCSIDLALLLARAIVHDIDETITGDVARPTKYFSPTMRAELHKLETKGMADIARQLDADDWLLLLHANAKTPTDMEGQLVAFADLLCAVHRVWEEVLLFNNHNMILPAGNLQRTLRNFMGNVPAPLLPVLVPLFDQLDAHLTQIIQLPTHMVQLHAHTSP